jgi:D-alanyl-D-alanine-carboxypeptidase/D-alanyl-D-alanine-endopeptidase
LKRCLLSFAALCAVSFSTAQAAQPLTAPVLASDIADRYANLIYYGSGATGMAMVVIDGNQRVFRSFGETRPGNNVHPQLDSVVRIASLTKLMTSEMLVKLLDQGVVKLDDPLSKYAPPGASADVSGNAHSPCEPRDPHQRCRVSSLAERRTATCLSGPPASSAGTT